MSHCNGVLIAENSVGLCSSHWSENRTLYWKIVLQMMPLVFPTPPPSSPPSSSSVFSFLPHLYIPSLQMSLCSPADRKLSEKSRLNLKASHPLPSELWGYRCEPPWPSLFSDFWHDGVVTLDGDLVFPQLHVKILQWQDLDVIFKTLISFGRKIKSWCQLIVCLKKIWVS